MGHILKTTDKSQYHFYVGTPNMLNVHVNGILLNGDSILINNIKLKITEIKNRCKSRTFPGFLFYELSFKTTI